MAEPYTYRQVIERLLAQIEERVYGDEDVPRWVMALTPPLHQALDRNADRLGSRLR